MYWQIVLLIILLLSRDKMFASAFLRDRIVSGLFNLLVLSLLVIGLRLMNFLLMGHVGLSDFLDGVLFRKQLLN